MVVRGECYAGFVSFLLWRNQLFRVLVRVSGWVRIVF